MTSAQYGVLEKLVTLLEIYESEASTPEEGRRAVVESLFILQRGELPDDEKEVAADWLLNGGLSSSPV
jgi:hypothetical protein